MRSDTPSFRPTPYGDVNAEVLLTLQAQFDTTTLLRLVDRFDALRSRFGELGMRGDLLRLHAMAHTVINGGAVTAPADEDYLWELAQALSDEISETVGLLQSALTQLQPLIELAPE